MGRIEEIKGRLQQHIDTGNIKGPEADDVYEAIDLISRLQIAEKALTEIYLDSVTVDIERIATEALEQIQKED